MRAGPSSIPRKTDDTDVVAEVLASELGANAHLAGHVENLLLELEISEATTVLVASGVHVIEVTGRGELDSLQAGLSGGTTNDDSEVVRRTSGSAESLDLGLKELEEGVYE